MRSTGSKKMEARYPPVPAPVRAFLLLYPVFVTALLVLFSGQLWLWLIAGICGVAWIGAGAVFLANTFRREGYMAAIDDLSDTRG